MGGGVGGGGGGGGGPNPCFADSPEYFSVAHNLFLVSPKGGVCMVYLRSAQNGLFEHAWVMQG